MRAGTRDKAVRQFLSAFLSGVFSTREIHEIASSLMKRDDFAAELGATLRAISDQLSSNMRTHRFGDFAGDDSSESAVYHTLRLVRDGGLTQRELIAMFDRIWPDFGNAMHRKRWSTAKLLQEFFKNARPEHRTRLLKELTHRAKVVSGKSDSYLDLISDRLRG